MELVGLFRDPRERARLPEPRDTWRCKACSWANVFRVVQMASPNWRTIETKTVVEK